MLGVEWCKVEDVSGRSISLVEVPLYKTQNLGVII